MSEVTSSNWRHAPVPVWIGRVLSGLFILFMLGASVTPKLFMPAMVEAAMVQQGWPPNHALLLGMLELVGVLLYAIPRTSIFGAIYLMAYLGGAVAINLYMQNPLFSHTLFSVYLGLFMWGGLWLRDPKLRELFPFRSA